jgi:hypothetical protein
MLSAKTVIYPNSLILEREGSTFLKKEKNEELTIWRGGTGPLRRRWLDSPDEAMARVYGVLVVFKYLI